MRQRQNILHKPLHHLLQCHNLRNQPTCVPSQHQCFSYLMIHSIIMMKQSYDNEDLYYQLLDYLKTLLKRQNLCHNTYLFKKMSNALTLPLHIIAEEKTVASITRDYQLITDALSQTGLVQINPNRQVKIIEHPTFKIHMQQHNFLREIESTLQQKDIVYQISKRYDQHQYINLTVFSQDVQWLQTMLASMSKELIFQKVSLIQDIRFGVDRIRKLKLEHAKTKTLLGKTRYSLQHPPSIFVRKAIDSSDEEQESTEGNQSQLKEKKGKTQHKKKQYRGRNSQKPQLHAEDFPQLVN